MSATVHSERKWGVGRQGFKCGYCSVAIELSALLQSGWQTALRNFWTRASHVVRPFYGDVRTLNGFIRSGATYACDMQTESHPVRGPFWCGIPRDPGHAAVLGRQYLELWTGFRDAASIQGELGFVTMQDWTSAKSIIEMTGQVPHDLVLQREPKWVQIEGGGWTMSWTTEYPSRWPFGPVPSTDAS